MEYGMLEALKRIREIGYNSEAFRATDSVLAIINVAEEAIRDAELAQAEPWGTLVGASDYLEHADRMSFLDLRRAKTAGYHETSIDFLQGRWIAIGEAWGIVQRLIKSEEQAKQPQEQATGI